MLRGSHAWKNIARLSYFPQAKSFATPPKSVFRQNKRVVKNVAFTITGLTLGFYLNGPYKDARVHADPKSSKILSIDGGGIRGILPLMILMEIEHRTGKKIAELFDFFAGTSTGGIIALGLTKKQPYVTEQIITDKIGLTSDHNKKLLTFLKEKNVIKWVDGKAEIQVVDDKGEPIDLDQLVFPSELEQDKSKIIDLLQDPQNYLDKPQIQTKDLYNIYLKEGGKIFSPPEKSWKEYIIFRSAEILTTAFFFRLGEWITNVALGAFVTVNPAFYAYCAVRIVKILHQAVNDQEFSDKLAINLLAGLLIERIIGHPTLFPFVAYDQIQAQWAGRTFMQNFIATFPIVSPISYFHILFSITEYMHFEKIDNKIHGLFFGAHFSSKPLENLLRNYFGKTPLKHTIRPVLVTSFDMQENRPVVFKELGKAGQLNDSEIEIFYAARATSAAPTYFPPLVYNGSAYVDGGVHANDPSMIAFQTAERELKYDIGYFLSLGTGHFKRGYDLYYLPRFNQAEFNTLTGNVVIITPGRGKYNNAYFITNGQIEMQNGNPQCVEITRHPVDFTKSPHWGRVDHRTKASMKIIEEATQQGNHGHRRAYSHDIFTQGAARSIVDGTLINTLMTDTYTAEWMTQLKHANLWYKRMQPELDREMDLAGVSPTDIAALQKAAQKYIEYGRCLMEDDLDRVCTKLDPDYQPSKQRRYFWENPRPENPDLTIKKSAASMPRAGK